jgi:hypothetical protein
MRQRSQRKQELNLTTRPLGLQSNAQRFVMQTLYVSSPQPSAERGRYLRREGHLALSVIRELSCLTQLARITAQAGKVRAHSIATEQLFKVQ